MKNIKIDLSKCKGCCYCIQVCNNNVLKLSETPDEFGYHIPIVINQEKCTGCKLCAIMCPDCAIEIVEE